MAVCVVYAVALLKNPCLSVPSTAISSVRNLELAVYCSTVYHSKRLHTSPNNFNKKSQFTGGTG